MKGVRTMDKIIYAILKEIKENENRIIDGELIVKPSIKDLGITKDAFDVAVRRIIQEELADIKIVRESGKIVMIWYENSRMMDKGEEYLKDNSLLGKTYKGLKEIREWLK
jgi:hypothetical protein